MKVEVQNLQGKKIGEMQLDSSVFGVKANHKLLQEVYLAFRSNQRLGLSHTKNRSERRGSTRKPWKQKGTGRARTGSVRNPLWRKGGIVFGPTKDQNFSKKVNKKAAQKALKMALSSKLADKNLVVVDSFDLKEKKTKFFAQALKALKIDKKVFVAFSGEDADAMLLSRNVSGVTNILDRNLNMADLLDNTFVLLSKKGLEIVQGRLLGEAVRPSEKKKETDDKDKEEERSNDAKDDVAKVKKTTTKKADKKGE